LVAFRASRRCHRSQRSLCVSSRDRGEPCTEPGKVGAGIEVAVATRGSQRQDRNPLGVEPTSNLDSGNRKWVAGADSLLRQRSGHGRLHDRAKRHFYTGHDGSLRSNRMICQTAGLYACDMFIGSTFKSISPATGRLSRWTGSSAPCERRGFRLRSQAPGLRRGSSLRVVFVLPYSYGVGYVRMQPAVRRAANAPIDDVRTGGDRMPAIEFATVRY
jgi:hypothetical protein